MKSQRTAFGVVVALVILAMLQPGLCDDPAMPVQVREDCPTGWEKRTDEYSCYTIVTKVHLNWLDAQNFCDGIGGHLATIANEAENNFVVRLLAKEKEVSAHIGIHSIVEDGVWQEAEYHNDDITDKDFAKWSGRKKPNPNSNGNGDRSCIKIAMDGFWYVTSCTDDFRPFVCEMISVDYYYDWLTSL